MPYVKESHGSYCQLSLQPNAVTDNDLLSLVAGISSDRAQDLFKHLKDYSSNPLAGLRHSNLEQLRNHLTLNQSLRVLAAIELGRRTFVAQSIVTQINSPDDAFNALRYDLQFQTVEKFVILILDLKNRLLATKVLSIGSNGETIACRREIFLHILKCAGTRAIVAHNHTSGDSEPSDQDLKYTASLLQAAQTLNIPIIDHLIVTDLSYTSLRSTTTLWSEFPQDDQ